MTKHVSFHKYGRNRNRSNVCCTDSNTLFKFGFKYIKVLFTSTREKKRVVNPETTRGQSMQSEMAIYGSHVSSIETYLNIFLCGDVFFLISFIIYHFLYHSLKSNKNIYFVILSVSCFISYFHYIRRSKFKGSLLQLSPIELKMLLFLPLKMIIFLLYKKWWFLSIF